MNHVRRPILWRAAMLALALVIGIGLGRAGTALAQKASTAGSGSPKQSCEVKIFDLNQDGEVTRDDLVIWSNWYTSEDPRADLDTNGETVKMVDGMAIWNGIIDCGNSPTPTEGSVATAMDGAAASGLTSASPLRTGGPDAGGYTFKDSAEGGCAPPPGFTSIIGQPGVAEITGSQCDDCASVVAIGFTFPFYTAAGGASNTSVTIGSNGYLSFSGTNFSYGVCMPTASAVRQISILWDDLDATGAGHVHAGTMAVCPGGRASPCWAAQWTNVPNWNIAGTNNTFQVFLFPDGRVEMQVLTATQAAGGQDQSTGVQNSSTVGLSYGCFSTPTANYLDPLPKGIFFLPPGITTCSGVAAVGADLDVQKSDAPDPVNAGTTLDYTVRIRNLGPGASTSVTVIDTLPTSTPLVTGAFVVTTPPGFTCSVVFPTVTCTNPSVANGYDSNLVIRVTVPLTRVSTIAPCTGTLLSNTATISSAGVIDPNSNNNSSTATTGVRAGSDFILDAPTVEFESRWTGDEAPAVECIAAGDFVLVTQSFINNGPRAVANTGNALVDRPGDEFFAAFPKATIGVPGSCTQTLTGGAAGTCTIDDLGVHWNGTVPLGARVTLSYQARIRGALLSGQLIDFVGRVNYDQCNTGINSAFRTASVTAALNCPGLADPNRQLWRQVHLPILNFQGQDDVCRTWIEVQNIGDDFAKAVLVTWGEPGFCPPQCAGPLKVECTGLLAAGATWNLLGAQIPTGSKGGMLFKFSARQINDLFPGNGGDDDIVADAMCEDLFFGVVGDCDDYRRFKKAYNEGLDWGPRGLNMGTAAGGGFLAVDVLRHCPGDVTPGVEVSSKYNGIAAAHLGNFDPVYGGYGFYVPLLYADKAGFNSIMYIQNGGLECSSIEIWFKAQDDCLRAKICEIFTLAPGETYQWDASDCVGPDWQGSAWLRSTQPLGIVVDIIGRDVLMSYMGEPAEFAYALGEEPEDQISFSQGNRVAYGPLMYSEYQGWDTGVQVQNLSPIYPAKVKAYFLDRSGDIITTLVDWICPRGSQTFFLPVITDLPGNWVGSIRVESQEWWAPGSPAVPAGDIVAVAQLIKYNDAARTQAIEAIAYNLLPEHKAYDWQIGFGGGGTESGVGLIAIPSLLRDLEGTGLTSEVAIANLVPKPGFTDFAIYIYDQNGLLDFVCQKLNEKQVEYINLQTWGYVNPGFKGSAIISAVFWEHDVFDADGFFLRNLLGMGAVSVERTGTRLGEDVPGDEAAGERGIPFAESRTFQFDFKGPNAPRCPGQPNDPPQPSGPCGGCPPALVSGILQASDPTFNSGSCTQQQTLGGSYFYDSYAYTLCADEGQTLTVSQCPVDGGFYNYDAYLLVYQPFFDPTNPCDNLVSQNDDACAGAGGGRVSTMIQPGPFEIVVTSWGAGITNGSYTLAISLACTPD
jgi:uncharacterized repeat protein (TIGR01451 family)